MLLGLLHKEAGFFKFKYKRLRKRDKGDRLIVENYHRKVT